VLQIVTETDANKQIKVMIKSASGQDFSQLGPHHDESEMISNASAFMSHSIEESRLGPSLSGVANLSAMSKSGRIDRLESGSGPFVALSMTSMQLDRDQLLIEGRVKPSLPLNGHRGHQQQRPASSASIGNRTQEEGGQRLLTAPSDIELKQLRIASSKMQMCKELLQPTRVIFDASEKVVCVCAGPLFGATGDAKVWCCASLARVSPACFPPDSNGMQIKFAAKVASAGKV
jgi:hypothetical protein